MPSITYTCGEIPHNITTLRRLHSIPRSSMVCFFSAPKFFPSIMLTYPTIRIYCISYVATILELNLYPQVTCNISCSHKKWDNKWPMRPGQWRKQKKLRRRVSSSLKIGHASGHDFFKNSPRLCCVPTLPSTSEKPQIFSKSPDDIRSIVFHHIWLSNCSKIKTSVLLEKVYLEIFVRTSTYQTVNAKKFVL